MKPFPKDFLWGASTASYQLVETTIPAQQQKDETSLFDGVDSSLASLAKFAGPSTGSGQTRVPKDLTDGLATIAGEDAACPARMIGRDLMGWNLRAGMTAGSGKVGHAHWQPGFANEVAHEAQSAKLGAVREDFVDRLGNRRLVFGAFGFEQVREPVAEERAVAGRIRQAQRIEAGRMAGCELGVMPVHRTDKDLGAAILVEEDHPRREALRLRGEEVEHHRLARARRADDGEIAKVVFVEVEVVGRRAGRLEQGGRFTPVVAFGAAQGKPVQRQEACCIGAG